MTASHHSVVYDPEAVMDQLPLDRAPQLALAAAALRWTDTTAAPAPADLQLIALQLTGHARTVTEELRVRVQHLSADTSVRTRAELLLDESGRRLSVTSPAIGDVAHTQNRARLVVGLYRALDSLDRSTAEPPPEPSANP